MNKKLLLSLAAGLLFSIGAQATVYLKYYNNDSESYTFEVKIGGSTTEVDFKGSTTSSVTIQGGSEECEIKTECGWQKVEDDDKITIKDGCISID